MMARQRQASLSAEFVPLCRLLNVSLTFAPQINELPWQVGYFRKAWSPAKNGVRAKSQKPQSNCVESQA
jgi:hypothetical protein